MARAGPLESGARESSQRVASSCAAGSALGPLTQERRMVTPTLLDCEDYGRKLDAMFHTVPWALQEPKEEGC